MVDEEVPGAAVMAASPSVVSGVFPVIVAELFKRSSEPSPATRPLLFNKRRTPALNFSNKFDRRVGLICISQNVTAIAMSRAHIPIKLQIWVKE